MIYWSVMSENDVVTFPAYTVQITVVIPSCIFWLFFMLATQFSRNGCEIVQRNSSGLFQVKSIVRRTLLFQGWNKNPAIKSVPTNHQDNFWVERKSKQQHFLSTCRRRKRRRLCWWLTSIRSRCPSPPSCFWPSTCRLPHCTRTRRSSSSSLKFLSSTSSTSSMAAQRRFVPNIKAYVLFQRCFTDSCQ